MVLGSNLLKMFSGKNQKFHVAWEYDFDSEIVAPLVCKKLSPEANFSILVATKDGRVYCLDEADDKVDWFFDLKEKFGVIESFFVDETQINSIYNAPSVGDLNDDGFNEIVVGSDSGNVFVISHDGNLLWKFKTKSRVRSSALLEDVNNDGKKEIVFGSEDKFLYCLTNMGKLLWKFEAHGAIESSPALLRTHDKNQIIFGDDIGYVYSITHEGQLVWEFKTGNQIISKPTIFKQDKNEDSDERYIVVGSFDKRVYFLNQNGALQWFFKSGGRVSSNITYADVNEDLMPEFFFGSCDNNLYCLNYKGDLLWNFETDFWIVDDPHIFDINDDGKYEIIVGSYDHYLYVFDSEGEYVMDYIPGISSVVQQSDEIGGSFTTPPGEYRGKLIYKHHFDDMIMGSDVGIGKDNKKFIVVALRNGKVIKLVYD